MRSGLKKVLSGVTYEDVLARVPGALRSEGFGVLTEIDLKRTFAEKLGVDFRRYTIFGACNPTFAYRALQEDIGVGLLLPCNVVVYEVDDGRVAVSAVDPTTTMASAENPAVAALAATVGEKLARALETLAVAEAPERGPPR